MPGSEQRLAGIGDEAGTTMAEQVAVLGTLGWRHIELRTIDGVALADLQPHHLSTVARVVSSAGLAVACLDSRIGNWASSISTPLQDDLAELSTLTRWCAMLGCRYVRIMSYPNDGLSEPEWRRRVLDRLCRLTAQAERAGIVLLHENCSGWAGRSAERMLTLLAATDSPALRLLFDTGNGAEHGYRSPELLAEVVDHVAHVHIKEAVHTGHGVHYTLPGPDATECVRILLAAGYQGLFSLEPHLARQPHRGAHLAQDAAQTFLAAGRALRQLLDEATSVVRG